MGIEGLPKDEPAINTGHLESVFKGITPIFSGTDIIRAAVWQLEDGKAARLLKLSNPKKIHNKGGHLDSIEELPWPITYHADLAMLDDDGVIVYHSLWMTDWDPKKANRVERFDYSHRFTKQETEGLKTPEDTFEAYDKWIRAYGRGHVPFDPTGRVEPNIFSPDGLEDLTLTAPREV